MKEAGQHLELHIPLCKVTLPMGPTRFCPCTHNHRQRPVLRKACEEFANTHYDANSNLGELTLYDGAVVHRGLANAAAEDRPVLVLAFAASLDSAQTRGYIDHLEEKLPRAYDEAIKYIMEFMEQHGQQI